MARLRGIAPSSDADGSATRDRIPRPSACGRSRRIDPGDPPQPEDRPEAPPASARSRRSSRRAPAAEGLVAEEFARDLEEAFELVVVDPVAGVVEADDLALRDVVGAAVG